MQLIDTPTGRYCIADGRSAADFIKALKTASKPKRPRLSTARPVRRFPMFYAGTTSTADYVTQYYALNFCGQFNERSASPTGAPDYVRDLFGELPSASPTGAPDYVRDLFGELPTTPASCPTEDGDEGDEGAYMVAVC